MDKSSSLNALSALGQETRLEIFRLLVKAGVGVPAGEIAERLGVVQNTTSAHLKVLTQAGLVTPRRDGRTVRYAADMTGFRDLLREKGTPYAELGLGDPKWSDDELIDAMQEHPILINRPVVVTPLGTKLCRPSEAVLDILPNPDIGPFTKEDGEVVPAKEGRRAG